MWYLLSTLQRRQHFDKLTAFDSTIWDWLFVFNLIVLYLNILYVNWIIEYNNNNRQKYRNIVYY